MAKTHATKVTKSLENKKNLIFVPLKTNQSYKTMNKLLLALVLTATFPPSRQTKSRKNELVCRISYVVPHFRTPVPIIFVGKNQTNER